MNPFFLAITLCLLSWVQAVDSASSVVYRGPAASAAPSRTDLKRKKRPWDISVQESKDGRCRGLTSDDGSDFQPTSIFGNVQVAEKLAADKVHRMHRKLGIRLSPAHLVEESSLLGIRIRLGHFKQGEDLKQEKDLLPAVISMMVQFRYPQIDQYTFTAKTRDPIECAWGRWNSVSPVTAPSRLDTVLPAELPTFALKDVEFSLERAIRRGLPNGCQRECVITIRPRRTDLLTRPGDPLYSQLFYIFQVDGGKKQYLFADSGAQVGRMREIVKWPHA